jgi:hypothetical protein
MTTAVVTIICIALVVVGGMAMSQGILTSADTAALSAEAISAREGNIMRTDVAAMRAEELSWADSLLRVTVANDGQTKLASFDKWDFIVQYHNGSNTYSRWLPYTEGTPGNNEWGKARICLDGQTEVFEPGILNPQEELVILAKLNPLPGANTTGDVTIGTPNGVGDSSSLYSPGDTMLVAHSENETLGSTKYYELADGALAESAGLTETTNTINRGQTGRWLLYNAADSTRDAMHLFSLTGIDRIPTATWTVYYRGMAEGTWRGGPWGNASLSINIVIRRADGSIRQTIANDVANANLTDYYSWETVSATYNFPGYNVVDDSDYLEIDYYARSSGSGPQTMNSHIRLRIDDDTLDKSDQTRIEA